MIEAVAARVSVRAELLEQGGLELRARFMDDLREQHLGIPRPAGRPAASAGIERPSKQNSPAPGDRAHAPS